MLVVVLALAVVLARPQTLIVPPVPMETPSEYRYEPAVSKVRA